MSQPESRLEFKNWILRSLGAPVINIEIDDTQLDDVIDNTLDFFAEGHFLGSEEYYFKQTLSYRDINNGFVILPDEIQEVTEVLLPNINEVYDTSGVAAFDSFEWNIMDQYNKNMSQNSIGYDMTSYYLLQESLSTFRWLTGINRQYTFNKLSHTFRPVGWNFTSDILSSNKLVSTDWQAADFSTFELNSKPYPDGSLQGSFISSTNDTDVFGITQEIDLKTYLNKVPFTFQLRTQASTYSGTIVVTIYDEYNNVITTKILTLENYLKMEYITFKVNKEHGSKITVEVKSSNAATTATDGFIIGNILLKHDPSIVLKGWRKISENNSGFWSNSWLQKMCTASAGVMWGKNISKFNGIALVGGVDMDGKSILDYYTEEKNRLFEEFDATYTLPADMRIA